MSQGYSLETLPFKNTFAALPEDFYARLMPTPLEPDAHLVHFNPAAAALIGLDPSESQRSEFISFFNGEKQLPGSDPLAALYAGHQFGHFVPQLGDGRAITLGEVAHRQQSWELQLKGAGLTPFSRQGDGRAVLRSTIREYLCSEAMHGLGIPTTRSLCLIGSSEDVYRETLEKGAMMVRMAPGLVRFGSFEVFYYRNQFEQIRQLADYVIAHDYPELLDEQNPYLALFRVVTQRTARMIAQWQLVGFAHGVMNSDNMSMLGLTLDYGPFGFLDSYDRNYICNHTDQGGRYAFDKQPSIGKWNLSCLGQAILPVLGKEPQQAADLANEVLAEYEGYFAEAWVDGTQAKLGLRERREGDGRLVAELYDLLQQNRVDHSRFFRALCEFSTQAGEQNPGLRHMFVDMHGFDQWAAAYNARLLAEQSDDRRRGEAMKQVNPKYILRNYLAQQAIELAQQGDYSEVGRLFELLQNPFDEQPAMERYADLPPDWAAGLALSCSS